MTILSGLGLSSEGMKDKRALLRDASEGLYQYL